MAARATDAATPNVSIQLCLLPRVATINSTMATLTHNWNFFHFPRTFVLLIVQKQKKTENHHRPCIKNYIDLLSDEDDNDDDDAFDFGGVLLTEPRPVEFAPFFPIKQRSPFIVNLRCRRRRVECNRLWNNDNWIPVSKWFTTVFELFTAAATTHSDMLLNEQESSGSTIVLSFVMIVLRKCSIVSL